MSVNNISRASTNTSAPKVNHTKSLTTSKKMAGKKSSEIKERSGLFGKNNRNDYILGGVKHSAVIIDSYGLTKCGVSSDMRTLKSPSAFGSEIVLKIAANKKKCEYSLLPRPERLAPKDPNAFAELIGSRIDYSLAPRRIPKIIPITTTRYGANHEWERNTSSLVIPIKNSSFYIDERARLDKTKFVDIESSTKRAQNAEKLKRMIPRNRCSV